MPPPLTSSAVANYDASCSFLPESQYSPSCQRIDRGTTLDSKGSLDVMGTGDPPTTPMSSQKPARSQSSLLVRLLTSPRSLRRLMWHRRKSSSSSSAASTVLTSPLSSAFSPSTPTTESIVSPLTPQTGLSPVSNGKVSKANSGNVAHGCLSEITPAQLSQIWSHGVYLANMGKHQSARLVFKHLMSRNGLPSYYLPLLAMNAGLLMLREHAAFPALHVFFTVSQQMCPTGPINLLALFAVGVAAWCLAHTNSDNAANRNKSEQNAVMKVRQQTLVRARDFFGFALSALDGGDEFKYDCFGFDFKLSRAMISRNKDSCERALRQVRYTNAMRSMPHRRIEKLPVQALFMPIELRSVSEVSETEVGFVQHPQFGTVGGSFITNMQALERSLSDCVLTTCVETKTVSPTAKSTIEKLHKMEISMKPLPPLPLDPFSGYVRRH